MRRVHLINFIRTMAVVTTAFLAPLRFLELGFGGAAIGIIVALLAAAPVLLAFPTGWLNDRLSMKKVIGGGLVAMALAIAAVACLRSVAPMAAAFLLLGVANNAVNVSINSLYYKDGREPDTNGKYGRFVGWLSLGPPAGLVLGGLLVRSAGFRGFLVLLAAVTALAALAVPGLGDEKFAAVSIREYRFGIFNRRTLLFSVFLVLLALHWGVEQTVYGPFLRTRLGLGDSGAAFYMAGAYLGLALAAFLVGRLPDDPVRDRRLFLLGMVLSGAGLILMTVRSLPLSFAFRFLHESGDGLMGAFVVVTISRLFAKATIGGCAGILTALQTSGHAAGSLLFAWMGFRAGLQTPMIVAGAVLIANAAFGLVAVPSRSISGIISPAE
ncbi:MAG TPA: MFS transporter [Candidatus Aminicenantes bacterium]|nr:MFS transporter [Candidatus Aminicenantes bacterium]HRY63932.1 MFS transporter [Candidatus Aminicenantes bacterium]HRZ70845.1 MFS transporter [Candidatus Aminicenantes bacterium]